MTDLAVIGAGCGRTGTASLKAALEELLGGKCYHMFELMEAGHQQLWIDAAAGKPDWDTIFQGFRATCDFPSTAFYADLMVKYPNAKVVLSVRNPESWYKSVFETIWSPIGMEHHWAFWIKSESRLFQRMCKGWRAKILGVPEIPITDKEGIIRAFNDWNAKVKATVPADRLLIHEAKDGWGPLCEFLELPEPSIPYPNVNDTVEFHKKMQEKRSEVMQKNALLFAGIGGALALVHTKTCKHCTAMVAVVAAGCLAVLMPKKFRGA